MSSKKNLVNKDKSMESSAGMKGSDPKAVNGASAIGRKIRAKSQSRTTIPSARVNNPYKRCYITRSKFELITKPPKPNPDLELPTFSSDGSIKDFLRNLNLFPSKRPNISENVSKSTSNQVESYQSKSLRKPKDVRTASSTYSLNAKTQVINLPNAIDVNDIKDISDAQVPQSDPLEMTSTTQYDCMMTDVVEQNEIVTPVKDDLLHNYTKTTDSFNSSNTKSTILSKETDNSEIPATTEPKCDEFQTLYQSDYCSDISNNIIDIKSNTGNKETTPPKSSEVHMSNTGMVIPITSLGKLLITPRSKVKDDALPNIQEVAIASKTPGSVLYSILAQLRELAKEEEASAASQGSGKDEEIKKGEDQVLSPVKVDSSQIASLNTDFNVQPSPIKEEVVSSLNVSPSPIKEEVVSSLNVPPSPTKEELVSSLNAPPSPTKEEVVSSLNAPPSPFQEEVVSPLNVPPSPIKEELVRSLNVSLSPIKEEVVSSLNAPSSPNQEEVVSSLNAPPSSFEEEVISSLNVPPSPIKEKVVTSLNVSPSPIKEETVSSLNAPSSPFQEEVIISLNMPPSPIQEEVVSFFNSPSSPFEEEVIISLNVPPSPIKEKVVRSLNVSPSPMKEETVSSLNAPPSPIQEEVVSSLNAPSSPFQEEVIISLNVPPSPIQEEVVSFLNSPPSPFEEEVIMSLNVPPSPIQEEEVRSLNAPPSPCQEEVIISLNEPLSPIQEEVVNFSETPINLSNPECVDAATRVLPIDSHNFDSNDDFSVMKVETNTLPTKSEDVNSCLHGDEKSISDDDSTIVKLERDTLLTKADDFDQSKRTEQDKDGTLENIGGTLVPVKNESITVSLEETSHNVDEPTSSVGVEDTSIESDQADDDYNLEITDIDTTSPRTTNKEEEQIKFETTENCVNNSWSKSQPPSHNELLSPSEKKGSRNPDPPHMTTYSHNTVEISNRNLFSVFNLSPSPKNTPKNRGQKEMDEVIISDSNPLGTNLYGAFSKDTSVMDDSDEDVWIEDQLQGSPEDIKAAFQTLISEAVTLGPNIFINAKDAFRIPAQDDQTSSTGFTDIKSSSEPMLCPICNRPFKFASHISEHVKIHFDAKPYKCRFCPKRFRRKHGGLRKHMLTHNAEKNLRCGICKKSFTQSAYLVQHMSCHTDHKPFKCELCGKGFKKKGHVQAHMSCQHSNEKPYVCSACGKSYKLNSHLMQHIKTHSDAKAYKCAHCSKSFHASLSLKRHMKLHSGEKPYECEDCGKGFIERGNWVRHLKRVCKRENEDRRFKCEFCDKRFHQRIHRKVHMRIHTDEIPFWCRLCGKGFKTAGNRKAHYTWHVKKHDIDTVEVLEETDALIEAQNRALRNANTGMHLPTHPRVCNIMDSSKYRSADEDMNNEGIMDP